MTLPTFLGIGVLRGGTTWLHELLTSHPDIYMPARRKEIFYFDLYYERGLEWYEGFFPAEADAGRYQALGEVTATYIYRSYGPERIARVPSITKLILMARNPVDRAYSHYGLLVKNGEYSGSFEAFLADHPDAIRQGFYSRYLNNYNRYFNRDQILVLIYEFVTADILMAKDTLARFLDVPAERFPAEAGIRRVNRSYVPRVPYAYAVARRVAWIYLRYRWDMDWIVNWGKRLGIERLFGEKGPPPRMKEETRRHLTELYKDEVKEMETLLGVSLDCWSGPGSVEQE